MAMAFFGWVAFLVFGSGAARSGLIFLALTAACSFFGTVGVELIDADLRERTRYVLGDEYLDVLRDEEVRARVPYRHLSDIQPDRSDLDGVGSADLPKPNGAPYFAIWNAWTTLIPALRPEYQLYMVPAVGEVCAELRHRAGAA